MSKPWRSQWREGRVACDLSRSAVSLRERCELQRADSAETPSPAAVAESACWAAERRASGQQRRASGRQRQLGRLTCPACRPCFPGRRRRTVPARGADRGLPAAGTGQGRGGAGRPPTVSRSLPRRTADAERTTPRGLTRTPPQTAQHTRHSKPANSSSGLSLPFAVQRKRS